MKLRKRGTMWHVDLLRNGVHVRGSLDTQNSDAASQADPPSRRCPRRRSEVDIVVTAPPFNSCRDILALRQSGRGTREMRRKQKGPLISVN
jgi:hypothetical protein